MIRLSIMHYPVRQEWTHGDFKIDLNLVISEKDKAFMAKALSVLAKQVNQPLVREYKDVNNEL